MAGFDIRGVQLDLSGSGFEPMEGSCQRAKEPSGSTEDEEFLDCLSN
jgi:hypothetical protein